MAARDIHVARAALADVFLDTPLVNAHTTACDVLWAGVPIVTLPLRRMASRVCASLVTAAGLGPRTGRAERGASTSRSRSGWASTPAASARGSGTSCCDEGDGGQQAVRRRQVGEGLREAARALWGKHARGEEPRSFELEEEEEGEKVEVEGEEKEGVSEGGEMKECKTEHCKKNLKYCILSSSSSFSLSTESRE